jgi:hypothetical protein
MINIDEKELAHNMSQSQAALLAVLMSDIRANIIKPEEKEALFDALKQLEQAAVDSIQANDGEVISWIGQAAKQANPLLCNS